MPEGDTIFRTARTLDHAMRGKVVQRFESVFPQLTRISADNPLSGRRVERVHSVGKHLLIEFSGGLTLRTHMRMNGSWHIYRPGERWKRPARSLRILIETDDYVAVGFSIPTAEFLSEGQLRQSVTLVRLGPDLLSAEFDIAEALRRIRLDESRNLAVALLDQTVVAGIGNLYKSELLFMAGISPFRQVAEVSDGELGDLLRLAQTVMRFNVRDASSSPLASYDGAQQTTGRLDRREGLWVYLRKGKPCRRCGTLIEYRKEGADARSTYWCLRCQR